MMITIMMVMDVAVADLWKEFENWIILLYHKCLNLIFIS